MIEKQTLLILGAGASHPYGFPTGPQLRNILLNKFPSFASKYLGKSRWDENLAKIKNFVSRFEKSSDEMIDYFLATNDNNPEIINIGKFGIFTSIYEAEIQSGFREKSIDKDDDWYSYLLFQLTNSIQNNESYEYVAKNKLTIITFNYDRSLENILGESLKNKFDLTFEEVNKILSPIKIIHVFGRLPKTLYEDPNGGLLYGNEKFVGNVLSYSNEIKTLNERSRIDKTEISTEIAKAERIFILGFGYAPENLELLNLDRNIKMETELFGTAYDFSEYKIQKLVDEFSQIKFKTQSGNTSSLKPIIKNCKSRELLEDYL